MKTSTLWSQETLPGEKALEEDLFMKKSSNWGEEEMQSQRGTIAKERKCGKGSITEEELKEKFVYVCVYMCDEFEYVCLGKPSVQLFSGELSK